MILLVIAAAVAAQVSNPSYPQSPGASKRDMSPVEAMLGKQDYAGAAAALGNVTNGADLLAHLDWERAQFVDRPSSFISFMYLRDLSIAADGTPDAANELRQTAALAALMAFATVTVDGSYCGDQTAPGHRLDQLIAMRPDVWAYMKKMPVETRKQLALVVPELEQKLASLRLKDGYDPFVCMGGMHDILGGLASGSVKEVETPKGAIGRTFEVGRPANTTPALALASDAATKVAKARAELPKRIAQLLDLE